mgnify:CR=1 FL=1
MTAREVGAPTIVPGTSLPTNVGSESPSVGMGEKDNTAGAAVAPTNTNGVSSGSYGQANHSHMVQPSTQVGGSLDVVEASHVIRKLAGITVSNDSLPKQENLPAETAAAISTLQIHGRSGHAADLKGKFFVALCACTSKSYYV